MESVEVESYIGKTLLMGLSWVNAQDKVVKQQQLSGTIERISDDEGIVVLLDYTNEEFRLPAHLGALRVAEPGEYTLATSGRIVVDPDYLVVWYFPAD